MIDPRIPRKIRTATQSTLFGIWLESAWTSVHIHNTVHIRNKIPIARSTQIPAVSQDFAVFAISAQSTDCQFTLHDEGAKVRDHENEEFNETDQEEIFVFSEGSSQVFTPSFITHLREPSLVTSIILSSQSDNFSVSTPRLRQNVSVHITISPDSSLSKNGFFPCITSPSEL